MHPLLLQPHDTALLSCTHNLLTEGCVLWLDQRELDARRKKGADRPGQRVGAPLAEEALPAAHGHWEIGGQTPGISFQERGGLWAA